MPLWPSITALLAKEKKLPPKVSIPPVSKTVPSSAGRSISFDSLLPSWRFNRLDLEATSPYSWHKAKKQDWQEVLDKLGNLETQTWAQLLGDHHHRISVDVLSKDAKQRLLQLKLDDYEDVLSIRLTGKRRVFGLQDGHACLLLWWDPHHKVCPSTKSHT